MRVDLIEDSFDSALYNSKATHPLQSWEWGEARKKHGLIIVRVGEFNGDVLMDVYQMTLHPIPHTPYKIGYLPRSRVPSKAVLDFLHQYGVKHNLIFIKIEPNERRSEILDLRSEILLVRSPHQLFPDWTMIVDLNKTEDELMAQMKQKTRYNVRLAQKKGVTVREESNDAGFEIFIKLYMETCRRQGYFGHTYSYHKTIWDTFKDSNAHILIAYFNEIPVAAFELFSFHDVLYYPYGGTSVEYRNTMAANLLMWETIKLGKKLNASVFDMWGSAPPDYNDSHGYAGFTRFKEGYGAEFTELVGSYDLLCNPTLYNLYNGLNTLRNQFLILKRKIS
jgi:lipid II:glycine glycyltransferase (peptidoglycan interpeptide bridge formation enzyme)